MTRYRFREVYVLEFEVEADSVEQAHIEAMDHVTLDLPDYFDTILMEVDGQPVEPEASSGSSDPTGLERTVAQ